jgi:hypothetical protein
MKVVFPVQPAAAVVVAAREVAVQPVQAVVAAVEGAQAEALADWLEEMEAPVRLRPAGG